VGLTLVDVGILAKDYDSNVGGSVWRGGIRSAHVGVSRRDATPTEGFEYQIHGWIKYVMAADLATEELSHTIKGVMSACLAQQRLPMVG
jgi:hypothetical protein